MLEKELIEKLREENKRLKAKLKPKSSYVVDQEDLFAKVWQQLQEFKTDDGKMKYFFERKPQDKLKKDPELVFKLNLFVSHLMEYKVRGNPAVTDDKLNTRLSMDKGSLIAHLSGGRVKRTRKGKGIEKPDLVTEMKAKPKPQPKPAPKKQADPLQATTRFQQSPNDPPPPSFG